MLAISSNHPCFEAKTLVQRCSKVLESMADVRLLSYTRYYYNGEASFVSQIPEVDYLCFQKNLIPSLESFHQNIDHAIFCSSQVDPPAFVQDNPIYDAGLKLYTDFNFPHRFILIYHFLHYQECFEFSPVRVKSNIINFFINKIFMLEKFCCFFKINLHDAIQSTDQYRLFFDTKSKHFLFEMARNPSSEVIRDFFREFDFKKITLKGKFLNCQITKREFECLFWMLKRKTSKEIGLLLSLSYRTIESYLENIKIKLGVRSKDELLKIAISDPFFKELFDF